VLYMLL